MSVAPDGSKPVVFCALDTPDLSKALQMAQQIGPVTHGLKLGLEFFNAQGPDGVLRVMDAAEGAAIFLDLKFHDIPNTVAGAVRSICARMTPAFLNVHASGGAEMMKAAKAACAPGTKLLAVTILTSLDEEAIGRVGYKSGLSDRVEGLALLAKESGLDGVVCSALEIERLRKVCGSDFTLMVPGIRPEGSETGDQKRVMTPLRALQAGANHLVIGRPITGAADPGQSAREILASLGQAA